MSKTSVVWGARLCHDARVALSPFARSFSDLSWQPPYGRTFYRVSVNRDIILIRENDIHILYLIRHSILVLYAKSRSRDPDAVSIPAFLLRSSMRETDNRFVNHSICQIKAMLPFMSDHSSIDSHFYHTSLLRQCSSSYSGSVRRD